jgi:CxxC motif-containing protein (DUF1111 family)
MGNATAMPGIGSLGRSKCAELGSKCAGFVAACIVSAAFGPSLFAGDSGEKKPDRTTIVQGRALFEREWQPGDSRTHGGDGLGPVYNDSSCVACHNQGGTGGAGSTGKNVDIVSATANNGQSVELQLAQPDPPRGFVARALRSLIGLDKPAPDPTPAPTAGKGGSVAKKSKPARPKVDTTELVKAHPGFRTARSIVLHRFGTDEKYEQWRQGFVGFPGMTAVQSPMSNNLMMATQFAMNFESNAIQNQIGPFAITRSQRNPTSLFGAGLIDSIAEGDIEAAAKVKHRGFSEIAGRVSRLKDKRIGRFGWKSQTASLSDFVLTACAVELGLEVPAHHQGGAPAYPDALPKGLDLNAGECDSLVAYVSDLPRPAERKPETDREAKEIETGRELFAKVGCAACHTPKLGNVSGLYSDLLLHDLGPALGDVGQYGVFDPSSSEDEIVDDPATVADGTAPMGPQLPFQSTAGLVPPPPASVTIEADTTAVVPVEPPSAPSAPLPPSSVFITAPPASTSDVSNQPLPPVAQAVGPVTRVFAVMPFSSVSPFDGSGNAIKRPTSGPASRFEWRTPPLWGFRDSAPYLHDGRAKTLDQAVAMHGGESTRVAQGFFNLSAKERRQVEAFLKSLTAPSPAELLASNSK